MNKKLIVAVLGLAFAGVAQAQSQNGVVLYGLVDGGLRFDRTNAGTLSSVAGGGASGSRLGVRGSEDLGNGMKANFVLEQGVDISDSSVPQGDVSLATASSSSTPRTSTGGRFFGRVATVGLSGAFGNVRLGRDYTPFYNVWSAADPFSAGTVGTVQNISVGNVTRFDNGIYYDAPSELLGGFKAGLALRLGESSTNNSAALAAGGSTATVPCTVTGVPASVGASCTVPTVNGAGVGTPPNVVGASKFGGNAVSISLAYASGPVYVGYGHNHVRNSLDSGRTRSHTLAGTYDFGIVKAHGLYWSTKDNSPASANLVPADANSWSIGLSAPVSGFNLMADYGRLDDKTANNFDARFFALGGTYALSRRTDFYAVASHLANRGNSHYLIADASNTGLQTSSNAGLPVPGFFGGNVNAGFSPSSFQVGMRHRF